MVSDGEDDEAHDLMLDLYFQECGDHFEDGFFDMAVLHGVRKTLQRKALGDRVYLHRRLFHAKQDVTKAAKTP